MKKFLALLLTMLMLVTQFVLPASAADAAEGPVVAVDISGYTGTSASIQNDGSGTGTTFTVSGEPTKGRFVNENGGITEYLTFGVPNGAGGWEGETANNSLSVLDESLNNLDESTVVFWLRHDGDVSKYYAGAKYLWYNNADNSGNGYYVRHNHNGYDALSAGGGAIPATMNTWIRIAVTRSYSNGAYTYYLHYNDRGAAAWGYTATVTTEKPDETDWLYKFGMGAPVSLANIQIYDRALTQAEHTAMYNAEKALYTDAEAGITELQLTSPVAGGVLGSVTGNIELNFNTFINTSTLSGITLKKNGTGSNLLGTPVSAAGTTKSVSLPYSDLENGATYVLAVSGVESFGGLSMTDKEFSFTVQDKGNLIVDTVLAEGGVAANKFADEGTRFAYTGANPEYGSFISANGTKTEYLQFGTDPEGDGTYTSGNETWLKIGDSDMNCQLATTVSFWINIESEGAFYRPIIGYGVDQEAHYDNAASRFEYQIWDYGSLMFFLAGNGFDSAAYGGTTWGNKWSHMVLTKEYNMDTGEWTLKWYRNGGLLLSKTMTVNMEAESSYVYILGGARAAKYSGIKLYNAVMSASELYAKESANYEVYTETEAEMLLTSPTAGGILSQTSGNINLTYNVIPDESALSGITLTAAGSEENLAGEPAVDTVAKTISVPYENLTEGARYTLTVAGVKSVGGLEAATKAFTFTVEESNGLMVDLQLNADGTAYNKYADRATTFAYTGSSATYGTFKNKKGGTTGYLEFGAGNGANSSAKTYMKIGNEDMNNKDVTTLSFWMNIENTAAIYESFIVHGKDKGSNFYGNDEVSKGNASFTIHEYSNTERPLFVLNLPGNTGNPGYVTGTSTWPNKWVHMTIIKKYSSTTDTTKITWYADGAWKTEVTAAGKLPDESGYVYAFGGQRATKFSGIKLYNVEKTPSTLYAAEKDLYAESPLSSLIFLNSADAVIEGFNGAQGSVTAYFELKNDDADALNVTPLLALYDGEDLVSCALGEPLAITTGNTGEVMVTLTLPQNITYTSNHNIKLFVWESLTSLKPLFPTEGLPFAADLPAPAVDGSYYFAYDLAAALRPDTVLPSA
ncbi:MAG: hypothetical protein IKL80_03290, partial [Clostridia bacterium]|nr:hypothetical protein [Clostridia bacterium]